MEYAPGDSELFPLPTPDEAAAAFGAPVYTFAPQRALEEAGCGTVGTGDIVTEVSLSHTIYRRPEDREHPDNLRPDADAIRTMARRAESAGRPKWLVDIAWRMRYPMLWEAVRTLRLEFDAGKPLAELLAAQVNHILINTFDERRHGGDDGPPTLDDPVSAADARPGILEIGGSPVEALSIDTDRDAIGWAAAVGDLAVFVVFAREFVPLIDLRLVRREPSSR